MNDPHDLADHRQDVRIPDGESHPVSRSASLRTRRWLTVTVVLVAGAILAWRSVFVLDDTQLGWLSGGTCGRGVAVVDPGVHAKWPWQSLCRFSRQVQWREIGPAERRTAAGGSVMLTAAACWRLAPEGLAQRVRLAKGDDALAAEIASVVSVGLDAEVAQHPLTDFLAGADGPDGRQSSLQLGEPVRAGRGPWILERYGVELLDVSVTRVAIPHAVHARRQEEEAALRQAEVDRILLAAATQEAEIRTRAEKDAEQIRSDAREEIASIRSEARARATRLVDAARRPELDSLLKVIEGYRAAMDKDTALVLEGGREFFRLIEKESATGPTAHSRPALPDSP
jgi:membrane protease subunit HflC